MIEIIGIREAARRLGVSDTAVRKAIKADRIRLSDQKNSDGRPGLEWPKILNEWSANTDSGRRTHVGGSGTSPTRNMYAPTPAVVELPTLSDPPKPAPAPKAEKPKLPPEKEIDQDVEPAGPSYSESRALRESYQAQLAKLELDKESGKLIDAQAAEAFWIKTITSAKTKVLGIPSACKSRYSNLPLEVVAIIEQVCREALEELANGESSAD